MTYQVLARKWRPKDFASLVGQEHVVRALTHALEQQRLHHAYLFTGTRGVGKTTLSRIFAKALNCETGITATPCGVCGACQAIDAGRFVDYVEMDAASNRGVDEMAALLERAVYAPVDARFKVYMIDEVHMLTNHAFNAMLKTLEEPPAHVKFILATTDPQKIPVTVLSRCLQFNLKQMPATHIVSHLEKVLAEEGVACEPQALRLLARAAEGSMRDALSLTDQAIAYAGGEVGEEAVRGMLGALDQSYLVRLLDALAANDGAAVLAVADEMALRSLSFSTALQDLSSLLHRIAWAQAAPGSVMDEWPEAVDIRRFAGALAPEDVQLYYQIATIGRSELGLAPDEYAGFTMALLRMLAFRPAVSGAAPAPPAARGSGEGAARGAGAVPAPATKVADLSTAPPGRTTAVAPPPDPAAIAPLHTAEHAVQPDTAAVPASASGPILPVSAAADAFAAGSVSPDLAARIPGSPETPAPATPLERPVPPPVASSARRPSGGPASAALEMLRGAGPRGASVRPQVPAPAPSRPRVAEPAISGPPGGAGSAPPGSTSVAPWEDMPPDDYPAYGSAQDESFVGLQEMPPGFDDIEEPSAASAHGREAYLAARATPAAAGLPEQPLSPAVSLAPLGFDGAWPALAVTLALKGISYQLAFNSELMALDDTILKLRVPVPQYADGAQVAKLKAALIERLGQQLDVQVEVGPARRTAAAAAAAAQALRQQQAERSIEQDPFVQSLIREFDATIVPGSIRPLPPPAAGQGPTPPVANF